MTAPHTCPTCGAPSPQPLDSLKAAVPPTMARIIDVVARRPGISQADLADAVYSDRADGGPDDAVNLLSVLINRHKGKLEALGWRVRGVPWRGYRLERVQ